LSARFDEPNLGHGQVIDVLLSTRRDAPAARTFFARALRLGPAPVEVTTDRAPV
jgi:IS6 family transposase